MPKLEGPDVSIEISLKEYGIAWKIGETETRFYYGIKHDDSEYVGFDWADLENNLDMHKEYDWANFKALSEFTGIPQKDWEKMPLIGKIQDLNSYYGYENIFGSTCGKPMTYEEVIKEAENKQFEVWSLDVWGNKEDGYTVNDRSKIGTVELSNEADKEEILQALFYEGIIADPGIIDTVGVEIIDSHPDWGVDDYGKPLFELTAEEGK